MILLYRTKWGLKLFGAGTNETAAYLSGVNVRRVRFVSFLISGVLASLIGLLLLGNMGIAFKDMGSNYVMPSIAAAVVGGVSLTGGDGNYVGVILGAIFLQTLYQPPRRPGLGRRGEMAGLRGRALHPPDRLREQPAQQVRSSAAYSRDISRLGILRGIAAMVLWHSGSLAAVRS